MQNKLQELTEKIFREGVEKGNAEAEQLVAHAKTEAENIVSNAKKEAEALIEDARKKAAEIKENTESEIRLSGKQAVNALKQEVTNLVNGSVVSANIQELFDTDFMKKILDTTLSNWLKSGQKMDLNVILPSKDEKALNSFFQKEAKTFLDKGVNIQFHPSIKSGFQLSPSDGSYKLSFTDDDFINFFKLYLRPKLVEILFS